MIKLIINIPFGEYTRGQEVTDEKTVKEILESHEHHVVKVSVKEPELEVVEAAPQVSNN